MSNPCIKVCVIMFLLTDVKSLKEVVLKCGEFQQPTLALQTENDNNQTKSKLEELGDRLSRLEREESGSGVNEGSGNSINCNLGQELHKSYNQSLEILVEKLAKLEEELNIETNLENTYCLSVREKALVATRKDCNDVAEEGYNRSGVYNIKVGKKIIPVYCDMESDGGKWLVFQRRIDGTQEFFLPWRNYTDGFGNIQHEFWLGLEYIHLITSPGSYQLRVDLEDWEGNKAYATYGFFKIRDPSTNYTLEIDGYKGTAGDAMTSYYFPQFSTYDRDNDRHSTLNCADYNHGAYWHSNCGLVNLNGRYSFGGVDDYKGITWWYWKRSYSLKRAEMKIRRN